MLRLQAFKFGLMPNGEQERDMRRFAGSCRFVFNKALALQKANYEAGGKFIGYVAMAKLLTDWRNSIETPWLKDAPVHPLQHALKDLERAYKNFFSNVKAGRQPGFPRFKRKDSAARLRYPDAKQFEVDQANGRVKLPKLGWMRYRASRDVMGRPKNITVSSSGGKWFFSVQTEREVEPPMLRSVEAITAIGIDVGIARFATFSDGSFVAPLSSFKRHEVRLRRYQRSMSRKKKFSNNWKKARTKVQNIHGRIANARKDFLHKNTTAISKNHAMVAVEDLQVRNMSRSAKGDVQTPGKQVRQKAGLNKAILDQGWFEFRRQLDYKLNWSGGMLVAVPAHYTSQTCPACGHVAAGNRKTQALFACLDCGYENNADVVGAMNILARGHRVIACGEDGSGRGRKTTAKPASVKQEPAEATARELTHA